MGAVVGLIVLGVIGFAIMSAGGSILQGAFDAFDDLLFDSQRQGLSVGRVVKAFFVMIPISVLLFLIGTLLIALVMGLLGYAFDQTWGFSSIYDWLGGAFSPKFVRWMIGAHIIFWISFIIDHWKPSSQK